MRVVSSAGMSWLFCDSAIIVRRLASFLACVQGRHRESLRIWRWPVPEIAEGGSGRGVLLTLPGGTSPKIAEAFGVREDTVRLWRSDFAIGDVEALKARVARGRSGSPFRAKIPIRAFLGDRFAGLLRLEPCQRVALRRTDRNRSRVINATPYPTAPSGTVLYSVMRGP
jgi:hypothetical protein